MAELVAKNRAAANTFFDRLTGHPVHAWPSLLAAESEVQTPQMLLHLASAAEEIQEDSPEGALAILDVADHLAALIPPNSFAYDYACLTVAARRAAPLADLGRFGEALSALRHARRFLSLGCSNQFERGELLVEHAYVYVRMRRFPHVLRALRLAARMYEQAGLRSEHDRTLRVLWLAMSIIPREEVSNVR